jgi:hypothetical protein
VPDIPPPLRHWTDFVLRTAFKIAGVIAVYNIALDRPARLVDQLASLAGLK